MSPISRPGELPPPAARTRGFGPMNVADTWGPEPPLSLWQATKLAVNVSANAVKIRLSRSMPPEPPEWDDAIPLPIGYWSHTGPFGYWQFENQTRGQVGNVSGAAYTE